jgi:hypothetical protein
MFTLVAGKKNTFTGRREEFCQREEPVAIANYVATIWTMKNTTHWKNCYAVMSSTESA